MLTRLFTFCLCASAFLPAALSQSSNGYNTFQSYMLTFDSAPDAALLAASRGGYTWIPESQGRQGLAYFERTQRNYIDMRNYPDYIGRSIPQIGGEMSVEIRMMQRDFGNWQRYYTFCNTTVDAGGWPNANPSGAVVRLANPGTATSYATLTAPGLGGTGDVSITSPDTEGRLGEWNHFVVTTEIRDPAAPENARGWTTIYLNGRVIVNGTTFVSGIGPRVLNWLGRSEYMLNNDAFFRGYMDNFAIYTYPMSAEAAYAHAQVNRPPAFELTFSKDPTTLANPITAPTYSWVASAGDFNKGVVALSGTSQSINLLSATGSSSVGTAVATQARTMQGAFSIEAIVSVTTLAANAPIFDAKDAGSNRIRMFTAANGAVTFSVNAATVSSTVNLVAGRFYHIVGTVSAAGGLTIYIDGQAAGTGTGSAVAAFTVTSAFLGQSTDATPVFLAGRFDAFRVYSTALTAAEITGLASTLNTVAPGTNGQVIRTAPTAPQSNPVSSFTFSKPPTAFGTMGLSTFDYVQSSVGRQGMAFFDGSKSFINLRDFPADDGSFMPTVFGGAMSFEISFQYLSSADQAMTYSLTGPRGASDNNLHLMNTYWQAGNGNINTIRSETYTERGFGGNTQLDCLGCTNGSWAHAIISIQQPNPTDFNSSNSASITMYVNGQLIASKFGRLPPTTYRPNLMLGQSGWAGDSLFYGNIDSFHWYNYALAPESASVHARLPTPPVFELSFYEDARRGAGNAPGFGWQFNEPTEVHQGLLVLSGGNQFADLSATSGANFVGFTIPASHGNGRNTPGVPTLQANGWAFDISFNPTSTATGVTLVDMSATGGVNGLSLAFGSNNQLVFTHGSATLNCGIVLANVWTHIAINVVQSGQNIDGQCYKNGVRVVTSPTFPAIPYVARTIALLGKSNTVANSNFNGMIDAFRVYSYSLTSEDVQELAYIYSAAQRVIDSPAYASGPILSHTFDVPPQLAFSDPTTAPTYNYWTYSEYGPDYASTAANRRRGVSVFNQTGNSRALRQYVDLSFDQDVYGAVIPTTIGGSLSFETWINFAPLAVLAPWQRIFDIAANDGQNNWNSNAGEYNRNLLLAVDGSNADRRLMFQHYASNGSSQPSYTIYAPVGQGVVPGTWQHIVATIETTSATAATMKLYVDGVLRASRADSPPVPYRRRPLAFLGRSNWDDPVLNATMDAFYMYNYALTEAQITRNRGLPYPPQFDASFETNPALTARSTYGWVNNDGITNHLGALTFDGNNQYVDLFSGSSASSIGQIFPVINGLSVGGVQGFSFELSCMWKSVTGNRRVFDLSNGEGVDSFAIGSVGSNAVMYVDNGLLDENSRFGLFKITPDVYYHLIVVGKPVGPANSTTMDYQIYVKGALVATMTGKIAPTQQARRVAFIGRSSVSGEQYFQGNVDLLRYYTYPIDARIAANLTALSGTNADYVAPDADSVIWAPGSSSSSTGGNVQPSTGATSQPSTSTGTDDGNGGGNAAVRSASNIVALIATVAFAALLF